MPCDVCGFRADLFTGTDLDSTLSAAPGLAGHVLHGAPSALEPDLLALLAPLGDIPREGDDLEAVHAALHVLHLAGCGTGARRRAPAPSSR